jgi:DNA-directed RNA polymerase subunit RPC12/RpoP
MRVYRCEDCGAKMRFKSHTKRGKKYKCTNCGHTGYVKGMTESNGSGIDLSVFGL